MEAEHAADLDSEGSKTTQVVLPHACLLACVAATPTPLPKPNSPSLRMSNRNQQR